MNWNKDSALRFVLDYLKGKLYTNVKLVKKNKFGHCYITTDNGNFYYLFKKDSSIHLIMSSQNISSNPTHSKVLENQSTLNI